MKNKEFIYKYWSKTELGRRMIASNNVSELDLLFLIPNNVKKRHGLPLTRISGSKKRKQKVQRKSLSMSFKCFEIIEELIEEALGDMFSNNNFIDSLVEVKNLGHGDKYIWKKEY